MVRRHSNGASTIDWDSGDTQSIVWSGKPIWDYLVHDVKVNLNLVDKYGDTPLTLAIKLNKKHLVRELLRNCRVDVRLCSKMRGKNPAFHVYCDEGQLDQDIFRMFLNRILLAHNLALAEINYENKTILHSLLSNVFIVNYTTLSNAIIPFVKMILDMSWNRGKSQLLFQLLTAKDASGSTPLMVAVRNNFSVDVLMLLIPNLPRLVKTAGGIISYILDQETSREVCRMADNNKMTPLKLAIERYNSIISSDDQKKFWMSIIRLLVEKARASKNELLEWGMKQEVLDGKPDLVPASIKKAPPVKNGLIKNTT